jgi:hypothetical protein
VRAHFVLAFRLGGSERYLIWYSDDVDGFVLDEDGALRVFADVVALRSYAGANGLKLAVDEPTWYDFDALITWLDHPLRQAIDPRAFLNVWNLFTDVRSSLTGRSTARDPDGGSSVYEKLFRANNLPSVTPPGKSFTPDWTDDDIRDLARVRSGGLQLFRSALARE